MSRAGRQKSDRQPGSREWTMVVRLVEMYDARWDKVRAVMRGERIWSE